MARRIEDELLELIDEYSFTASSIERIVFTRQYEFMKSHYEILAVQSISMLYSLWEGFVQKAFGMYVDYLNGLDIDFRNFSDRIRLKHMERKYKQFHEYPQKIDKRIAFLKKLEGHHLKDKHSLCRLADTKGNVGFSEINTLLEEFSLEPFPEFWGDYSHPNKSLKELLNSFLRLRNNVAHGGDAMSETKVTQEAYAKYRIMVKDLMYSIHDRILKGIEEKTYLNN